MDIETRFRALADEWEAHRRSVLLSSDILHTLGHPAFGALVGLGAAAIPLMIRRYRSDALPWCFVLQELARGPAVANTSEYRPEAVRQAWLAWWESGAGTAPGAGGRSSQEHQPQGEAEALSREYAGLRKRVRRGARDPELRHWGGRMHEAMARLGELLGGGDTPESEVVRLMGTPDRRAIPEELLFTLATRENHPDGVAEILVYEWRGGHDFLYFASDGRTVLGSGWWMAGD